MTCCGKSFCRKCIERVTEGDHGPCPCCKEDNFSDFPNKGLQQPLYGFKVYCTNKERGCHWKDELGQLDNHLNMNPSNIDQLKGCNIAEIKWGNCKRRKRKVETENGKRKTETETEIGKGKGSSLQYVQCHSTS